FGVDASLILANANQTRGIDSKEGLPPDLTTRVVEEYLETLDDAAFGASTDPAGFCNRTGRTMISCAWRRSGGSQERRSPQSACATSNQY
ncbi:hypothetical protein MUB52_23295, partial [Roseobacter sp. WL0113]|nr:hypothetical protein [Roseobacter sp. WL0113]